MVSYTIDILLVDNDNKSFPLRCGVTALSLVCQLVKYVEP